jgi:hypothetical protein
LHNTTINGLGPNPHLKYFCGLDKRVKVIMIVAMGNENKYGPSSIKSVEKVNDLHGVVNGFNSTFSTKKIINSNLLVLILLVCMKCKGARL